MVSFLFTLFIQFNISLKVSHVFEKYLKPLSQCKWSVECCSPAVLKIFAVLLKVAILHLLKSFVDAFVDAVFAVLLTTTFDKLIWHVFMMKASSI